jgi:TolB protein
VLVVSNRDGNAEIYLVALPDAKPDDKPQAEKEDADKNLTNNGAEDIFPAWSPDGKRIVFTSTRDGGFNLYVMDADGKNVRQLTTHENKYIYCAAWSPDGKRIVYNLRDQNGVLAMLLDPDTGSERPLASNAWDPAWSPDGKRIAFTKLTENGYKIHVMDADALNARDIGTDPNAFGWSYPAWSPDGKKIAYANREGDNIELFVSDPDGKNKTRVTNLVGTNSFSAWSPDGKRILFRQTTRVADAWPLYWVEVDSLKLEPIESLKGEPPLNNFMDPGRVAIRPKAPAKP